MNTVLPLITSIVSFVFALMVLEQFRVRRKPHQLAWAIGLLMYSLSAATEFWSGAWGINLTNYRLWYLFGAVLVVAYLGMGTIYLLTPRKIAHLVMAVVLAASIYAAVRVYTASVDLGILTSLSGQAMPANVRAMTPAFNGFGTIALVGGAIYSAISFWRRRIMPHRVVSNTMIAVGAILPAIGGTSLRLTGDVRVFYLLELLGIVIIFLGFLRSQEVFGYRGVRVVSAESQATSLNK